MKIRESVKSYKCLSRLPNIHTSRFLEPLVVMSSLHSYTTNIKDTQIHSTQNIKSHKSYFIQEILLIQELLLCNNILGFLFTLVSLSLPLPMSLLEIYNSLNTELFSYSDPFKFGPSHYKTLTSIFKP